ncbi:hypothetical protein EDD85DRAFT_992181 [Armillaria nabsnona]|nr:hypothetical protein EDD85DRAFT_992181 [Armillaria nabsnona]
MAIAALPGTKEKIRVFSCDEPWTNLDVMISIVQYQSALGYHYIQVRTRRSHWSKVGAEIVSVACPSSGYSHISPTTHGLLDDSGSFEDQCKVTKFNTTRLESRNGQEWICTVWKVADIRIWGVDALLKRALGRMSASPATVAALRIVPTNGFYSGPLLRIYSLLPLASIPGPGQERRLATSNDFIRITDHFREVAWVETVKGQQKFALYTQCGDT